MYQNKGNVHLGKHDWRGDCWDSCKNWHKSGKAITGCQYIHKSRECTVHTEFVTGGNGDSKYRCMTRKEGIMKIYPHDVNFLLI